MGLTLANAGALDGSSYALQSDGFSEPAKQTHRPLRLNLPAKFRSVTYVASFFNPR